MSKDTAAIVGRSWTYNATLELYTANCNLQCLYCYMHTDKTDFPDYPRHQMAPEVIDHSRQLFARDRPIGILLCGNGETTILEDWTTICEPFLSFDNVGIMSNLAKVLSWEEASFLARFGNIVTSIDTADAELLREIRRPVQLRDIVMNLNLVRTAAVVQGHPPPSVTIHCTVTTKNYRDPTRLVAMASTLGVDHVFFSDVFETATAITHGVRSIAILDSVAMKEAATEFQRASALAAMSGITISVGGPRLAALLSDGGAAKADAPSTNLSTVLCLQPWSGFWVNADGHASYCCRHIAPTDKDITCFGSVREILNDVNAVHLREALLSGCPPARCRSCELGQPTDPSGLSRALQSHGRRSQLGTVARVARRLPLARATWRTLRRIPRAPRW